MSRHALSLPLSHPGVVCTVQDEGETMFVFYWGTPQDLIAAGCGSPEMLDPNRKGITRRDEHGDRVYLKKSPNGRWRVMRVKPRATAMHLPGVEMYLRTTAAAGCPPPEANSILWALGRVSSDLSDERFQWSDVDLDQLAAVLGKFVDDKRTAEAIDAPQAKRRGSHLCLVVDNTVRS
jgi:hypothetical protein